MLSSEDVRSLALGEGFDQAGIARAEQPDGFGFFQEWIGRGFHAGMDYLPRQVALRRHPEELLPGTKSVIAVSLNYLQDPPEDPKIARYALGRDYHRVLRGKLKRLASRLSALAPEAGFRACVDSAPILEREFAHKAGLGWFGKNTMLIDSRRGSWFFLGLLLTTLELEPDAPAEGGCGTCAACIEACPTGAIVQEGGRWQIDSRRCISYQTIEHRGELSAPTHGWVFGCDICQEVCPFNQPRASQPLRAVPTQVPDFAPRVWPPTLRLEVLEYGDWDALTEGSAVRRAGFEGLRRNAQAALRQKKEPA